MRSDDPERSVPSTLSDRVAHDPRRGRTTVYDVSMLFHCNHYNRTLQQFVEDPGYLDAERIILQSAAETVARQTERFLDAHPEATVTDVLDFAERLFSFAGFGTLDCSDLVPDAGTQGTVARYDGTASRPGGVAVGTSSHYGDALQLNVGERSRPGEYFDRGFLAGVLCAAGDQFDLPYADGFAIRQPESISLGDDRNRFVVDLDGDYRWRALTEPAEPPALPAAPPRDVETPVDEAAVIEAVAGLDLTGNDDGLIPAFGLYLTRNYADFYNKVSFRFRRRVAEELSSQEIADELLVETGHRCGFHTFGGIMTSPEWDAVVGPMLESSADWIHGIVAVINALGWGIWRVAELVPGERLVIRVYDCYESIGYRRWFGRAETPVEFLVQGGAAALMNLVYYGDIATRDGVEKSLYSELFEGRGGFDAELTRSVATGDDVVEVVVTR